MLSEKQLIVDLSTDKIRSAACDRFNQRFTLCYANVVDRSINLAAQKVSFY